MIYLQIQYEIQTDKKKLTQNTKPTKTNSNKRTQKTRAQTNSEKGRQRGLFVTGSMSNPTSL